MLGLRSKIAIVTPAIPIETAQLKITRAVNPHTLAIAIRMCAFIFSKNTPSPCRLVTSRHIEPMQPSTNKKATPERKPLTYLLVISHLLHMISREQNTAPTIPQITVQVVYFAVSASLITISLPAESGASAWKIEIMTTAAKIIRIPMICGQVTLSPMKQPESKVTIKQSLIMMLVPSPWFMLPFPAELQHSIIDNETINSLTPPHTSAKAC